nr:MAG TPA: hypothetical protein [Caudoviricetes sp.]
MPVVPSNVDNVYKRCNQFVTNLLPVVDILFTIL